MKAAKGTKAMPEESTNDQKDFIVVGGKRRWFSVSDSDDRFNGLHKRVSQERNLSIPDRPTENL